MANDALIRAKLDYQASKTAINSQLKTLTNDLNKLNLKVNIDSAGLKDITAQIEKVKQATKSTEKTNPFFNKTQTLQEIDIIAKKAENTIRKMQATKGNSVFSNPSVSSELGTTQTMIDQFRKGTVSTKDLSLQMDNLRTKATEVSSSLKNVNRDGYSFNDMIGIAVKKIALWGISTQIIYGSLNTLKEGFQFMVDMNAIFTNLQMEMTKTNLNFEDITNTANNYARAMGTTTDNVMKAISVFGTYNSTMDQVLTKSKAAIILSNLTGQEITTTSDDLMGTMSQYELSAESAMHVVDIIAGTARNLQVDYPKAIDEISKGLRTVGSVAKESKATIEETSAMIGTLTEKNRKTGTENANALRTIFGRILNVGEEADPEAMKKVEKQLTDIGVTIREIGDPNSLRPIGNILADLSSKWSTLNDVQKQSIAFDSAGMYRKNTFITLMENYGSVIQNTNSAINSSGVAMQKQEIYEKSMNFALQELTNSWESFYLKSFNSEAMIGIINFLSGTVRFLNNIVPVLGLVAGLFMTFGKTTILNGVVGLANGFIGLKNSISSTKTAMVSSTIATDTNTVAVNTNKVALAGWAVAFNSALGVIGLVVTAVSLVSMAIGAYTQAQEENKQKALESAETYNQESSSLSALAQQYADLANSTSKTEDIKNQLISIQDQLISSFGDEAKGIDLVNGKYDEQIAKIQALSKEQAQQYLNENVGSYNKASDDLSKKGQSNVYTRGRMLGITKSTKGISLDNEGGTYLNIYGNAEQRSKVMGEILQKAGKLNNLTNGEKNSISALSKEYTSLNKQIEENKKIVDDINTAKIKANYSAQISSATQVVSAYKTALKGGKSDDITKTTKDVEAVKKSFTDLLKTKDAGLVKYLDEIFAGLGYISENAKKVSSSTETASVAFSDLLKSVQDTKDGISDLESALDKIQKGQSLSSDEVLKLIANHTQLAGAISLTADGYTISQTALENLISTQKEDAISAISDEITKTNITIGETKKRIDAYKIEAEAKGALSEKSLNQMVEERDLNIEQDKLKQLTNLQTILSSPNKTGSSSGSQKTALDKYLEEIDHLKKIGQMTEQQELDSIRANKGLFDKYKEQWDYQERIYSLQESILDEYNKKQEEQKQANRDAFEHEVAMGNRTIQQQIDYYSAELNNTSILSEQQDIEEKIYQLKKQQTDEVQSQIDKQRSLVDLMEEFNAVSTNKDELVLTENGWQNVANTSKVNDIKKGMADFMLNNPTFDVTPLSGISPSTFTNSKTVTNNQGQVISINVENVNSNDAFDLISQLSQMVKSGVNSTPIPI